MVGVKWLRRCDVFISQVAGISGHGSEGTGDSLISPKIALFSFKDTEFCVATNSSSVHIIVSIKGCGVRVSLSLQKQKVFC